MRRFMMLLLLPLMIAACSTFDIKQYSATVTDEKSDIKRVAVIDFDYDRPERGRIERGKISRPKNAGVIVADIFTEHLLGSGLYQIVERKQINRILQKHNLRKSDLFNSPDWQEIKQILNVDALVTGVVIEYGEWRSSFNWGAVTAFTARLVEVESGLVVWSVSANQNIAMTNAAVVTHAASEDALKDLLAKLNK